MLNPHVKGPFPLFALAVQPLPALSAYIKSFEIDTGLLDFVILNLSYVQKVLITGGLKMKWEFQSGGLWKPASISDLVTFVKTAEGLETMVDVDIRRFPFQSIATDFKIITKGRDKLRVSFADADPVTPGDIAATFSCWVGSQLG